MKFGSSRAAWWTHADDDTLLGAPRSASDGLFHDDLPVKVFRPPGILRLDHKKTIFSPTTSSGASMRYSRQIKPISYLKANAAAVLQELEEQRKPLIITQNGEAKAVLQDVASYEETQETLALLKILALGSQQVERGEVTPVSEVAKRLRSKATAA